MIGQVGSQHPCHGRGMSHITSFLSAVSFHQCFVSSHLTNAMYSSATDSIVK